MLELHKSLLHVKRPVVKKCDAAGSLVIIRYLETQRDLVREPNDHFEALPAGHPITHEPFCHKLPVPDDPVKTSKTLPGSQLYNTVIYALNMKTLICKRIYALIA